MHHHNLLQKKAAEEASLASQSQGSEEAAQPEGEPVAGTSQVAEFEPELTFSFASPTAVDLEKAMEEGNDDKMICYSLFAVIFTMIFVLLFASHIRSFTDIRMRISYRTSLHMLKNICYYLLYCFLLISCYVSQYAHCVEVLKLLIA